MTLEDFFTLTEMKDGLTAPSRVEELVTVMRKEKDSDIVKNIGDATRQWAAVASTISATENKDCLDLFIQLNGLWFIDRWLKDASKFSADSSDGLMQESLTALLRAVEKLHIGNEKSVASGISITVKNLLNHKSSQVQDRAKALFDSWGQVTVDEAVHSVVEIAGKHNVSLPDIAPVKPERVDACNSVSKGNGNVENNSAELKRSDTLVSTGADCPKQEVAEDQNMQTCNEEPSFNVICNQTKVKDRSSNLLTSGSMEGTTTDDSKWSTAEVQPEVLESNDVSNDKKPFLKLNTLPGKLSMRSSFSSATGDGEVYCGNEIATAQDVVTESTLQNNIDDAGDVRTPASLPKVVMEIDDIGCRSQYTVQILKTDDECGSDGFQDLSSTACRLGKTENTVTNFSQMEDDTVSKDHKKHSSNDEDEDVRNFSEISTPRIHARNPDIIGERISDMELEYGIVDALEVARQVAQAVEKEVVDSKEHSCSLSMEKTTEKVSMQPGSPDSVDGKQEFPAEVPPRDIPSGQLCLAEVYTEDEQLAKNTLDNLGSEVERDKHNVETCNDTKAAQEPEVKTEKGLCDFDLNQEVDSDENEHIANPISSLISVPVSRPVAPSGSTVPFHFEGSLGWKGSAATSAFRPASPHQTLSTWGTSSGSSQRQFCLEIDLNMADGGDEKIPEMNGNEIPGSSALHGAESCLEASPIKSEGHKLDLNLTSDGDATISGLKIEGHFFHNRNSHLSLYPSSSSSSMQPSARNFDLNDRPHLLNDSTSDQGFFLGKSSQHSSAYEGPKPDDSVKISIMGTKVEVGRKDFMAQTTSLPHGKDLDIAMDAITAREGGILHMTPTVSYIQSNVFDYNGPSIAPTMSFSSAMYGPRPGGSFPYVVDSRGSPVVPQVVASAVPPYSNAPLWLSPMNGVVDPRPNFDLNSGFTAGGGNRDSGVFRQFLTPAQSWPMEEHLRTSSQPSSSGVGGKRKEPDGGGFEPSPFNYRNQQPPWT